MTSKNRLLRSTSAKTNYAWVIIAILLFAVLAGAINVPKINLSGFDPFNLGGGGGASDLVNVDKQLKFALVDKHAGSALASKTIYVYDDTKALLESLTTDSDGTKATAFTYPSGKHIFVKYLNSNSKQWFDIIVPQMNSKDAEAATYNNIPLKSFAIGTYSSSLLSHLATNIADTDKFNYTLYPTPTFSYKIVNTGNDNTGMMDSQDPIYGQGWQVWLYVTFAGSGYEGALPYGFDHDFTLGTTHYVAKQADVNAMTKWKVGNNYVAGYEGTQTLTWSCDFTGVSGTAVDMQLYLYAYTDPSWTEAHGGNYGVSAYQLDEITVNLDNT